MQRRVPRNMLSNDVGLKERFFIHHRSSAAGQQHVRRIETSRNFIAAPVHRIGALLTTVPELEAGPVLDPFFHQSPSRILLRSLWLSLPPVWMPMSLDGTPNAHVRQMLDCGGTASTVLSICTRSNKLICYEHGQPGIGFVERCSNMN